MLRVAAQLHEFALRAFVRRQFSEVGFADEARQFRDLRLRAVPLGLEHERPRHKPLDAIERALKFNQFATGLDLLPALNRFLLQAAGERDRMQRGQAGLVGVGPRSLDGPDDVYRAVLDRQDGDKTLSADQALERRLERLYHFVDRMVRDLQATHHWQTDCSIILDFVTPAELGSLVKFTWSFDGLPARVAPPRLIDVEPFVKRELNMVANA